MCQVIKKYMVSLNNIKILFFIAINICFLTNCGKKLEDNNASQYEHEGKEDILEENINGKNETFVYDDLIEWEDENTDSELSGSIIVKGVYAFVKRNNTEVFINPDVNSNVIFYFQKGDVFKIQGNLNKESGSFNENMDFYYTAEVKGWVYKDNIECMEIRQGNNTTMGNSKIVNQKMFPTANSFYPVGFESFPNYIQNETSWVVYNNLLKFKNIHGLTIKHPNLPDKFKIWIYSEKDGGVKRYFAEKDEVDLMHYDFLQHDEIESISKLLPIYTCYFPAWPSMADRIYKTELRTLDDKILLATDVTFPKEIFIIKQLYDRCFYLQYSGKNPIYIVLYRIEDFNKGVPVKAFCVNPEDEIWNGVLSISENLEKMYGLGLILFEANNIINDNLKPINNYFPYYLDF